MVQGSDKTYGALMLEARAKSDSQQVGETVEPLMDRFKEIIEDAVQKNHDNGITGKYYIHIWVTKEPYATNSIHIYPQCRRSRPSPYQGHDHYLWSINGANITFEWCIPKKEIVKHILANPSQFDEKYVTMLRKYCADKIEKISDYVVGNKVI